MPSTGPEKILNILKPRVSKKLLEGFHEGVSCERENAFYAATFVRLSEIDYNEFAWYHGLLNGTSYALVDEEKTRKYINPEMWQNKSTRELIDEGILLYFSVTFLGVYFEQEWFILPDLVFYGNVKTEAEVKNYLEQTAPNPDSLKWASDPR